MGDGDSMVLSGRISALFPVPGVNASISRTVTNPKNVLLVRLDFYRQHQRSSRRSTQNRERRTECDMLRVEPTPRQVPNQAPKPRKRFALLAGLTYLAARTVELAFVIQAPNGPNLVV